MASFTHTLPANTPETGLLALIDQLNGDDTVDGILVQLPLLEQIDAQAVIDAIDPAKDVDGFMSSTPASYTGGAAWCHALGCAMLLKDVRRPRRPAVILGRLNIVGKFDGATAVGRKLHRHLAHSRTRDLAGECRQADILAAAVGRPEMVRGEWIKPGAAVIDVGINRIDAPDKGPGATRLVGDVAFHEAAGVAGVIPGAGRRRADDHRLPAA